MSQLFFKKHLQDAIRAGRKQTTIRRWARPQLCAGKRVYALGLGWLNVEGVEPVELDRLSDIDAQADGFDTIAALRAALFELFPDHATDGKQWFRVRFSLPTPVLRGAKTRPDLTVEPPRKRRAFRPGKRKTPRKRGG
ncbi:MAG: hypothetical protein JWP03_3530 [Phycisphaerales bacterium]|nr:hypothetical protein [Phycisphaerales bacterium]